MVNKIPNIIKEVGFDFDWDNEKVWALDIAVAEMPIQELEWHFEIPFWNTRNGYYDLKPIDVIENPKEFSEEFDKVMSSDVVFPLDIMFWKNRWLLLDGLHRLLKLKQLGKQKIKVRKVPTSAISLIRK